MTGLGTMGSFVAGGCEDSEGNYPSKERAPGGVKKGCHAVLNTK